MNRRPYWTPTEIDIVISALVALACIPVIMYIASAI